MTLATRMAVVEPTPYRELFDFARSLIGAQNSQFEEGPNGIQNKWGQGYASYIGLMVGMDAPLTPGTDDDERGYYPPVDEWSIEVHLDTAYSYRADNGAGCSDLHAYLVQQLGQWLSARGLTWYWYHEHTAAWHSSSDPITILGNPERGRLPIELPR